MSKLHALREDIRNDEKPIGRHVTQFNWSSDLNLVFALLANDRGFLLEAPDLSTDPGYPAFLGRRSRPEANPDQHHDAVAKQNCDAGLADPDG
jgi:hypothetical protein